MGRELCSLILVALMGRPAWVQGSSPCLRHCLHVFHNLGAACQGGAEFSGGHCGLPSLVHSLFGVFPRKKLYFLKVKSLQNYNNVILKSKFENLSYAHKIVT